MPVARRSSSSTARASSNGSITALESLPSASAAPASSRRSAGPMPSARSRSVVGQPGVSAGEGGGVHGGEVLRQRAGGREQSGRRVAVGREAGLVLGRLLGDVGVQRRRPLP